MYVPFSSDVTRIEILTQFHKIFGSRRRNIFIVLQKNQINVRKNRKGNPKTLATLGTRHTNKQNHNRKGNPKTPATLGTSHTNKQNHNRKGNPKTLVTLGTRHTNK
jgi:hypothetical protein